MHLSLLILACFHTYKTWVYFQLLRNRKLLREQPWQRSSWLLRVAENALYAAVWLLIMLYIAFRGELKLSGLAITTPAVIACCITCFCIKYEETPCNATMQLMSKVIIVLRLFIGFSAALKLDQHTKWDWSTTFWPYWCSFAIQGIMGIASLIIFFNTVLNYLKEESTKEDSKLDFMFKLQFWRLFGLS